MSGITDSFRNLMSGADMVIKSSQRSVLSNGFSISRYSFWIILLLFLIGLSVWIQFIALDRQGETAGDLLLMEIERDSQGTSLSQRLMVERQRIAELEQEKRERDAERRDAVNRIDSAQDDLRVAKRKLQ